MTAREFAARRRSLGLTQRALASRLGLTVTTISNYERGANPVPHVVALALDSLKPGENPGPDPA